MSIKDFWELQYKKLNDEVIKNKPNHSSFRTKHHDDFLHDLIKNTRLMKIC